MDKEQAIHTFWSSFGWTAIDENSAFDEPTMESMGVDFPYIAYDVSTGSQGEAVSLTASLYDRSTSWMRVSQKAEEIAHYLEGSVTMEIEGGYVVFYQGVPFSTRLSEDSDSEIRRVTLNVDARFMTGW